MEQDQMYPETCPSCGSDSGHYSKDSKVGEEIWLCESCGHEYTVSV